MNKWFPYLHGGYAEHPCVQLTRLQRLAVRPIRPYPHGRIRTKGGPLCAQLIFYEV